MISIVIPCYNSEATLEQTLRSVLAQDVDKEIVVVDDGSTDATAAIAASFGPAVRCVSVPNAGVSAARNLGAEMARGDFVLYLDSDDLLVEGTLSARLAAIQRKGDDVAYVGWQKLHGMSADPMPGTEKDLPFPEDREALEISIATARVWAPPATFLFRRTAVEGLRWATDLLVVQDVRFLFDVAARGARFVRVPGIGVTYRVLEESLSRASAPRFVADCVRFTDQIEAVWTQRGALTPGQSEALEEMWSIVTTASLVQGLPEFRTAFQGYRKSGRTNLKFELGRALRSVVGAHATARCIGVYMGAKDRARALRQGGVQRRAGKA
jgi:glycosyltransferase involved in cell wall biosynthesis